MPLKLYYRADSRSPKEIFSCGFQPRTNDALNTPHLRPWWFEGLRRNTIEGYQCVTAESFFDYAVSHTQTMDANANNVISISQEFETTPIFPINQTKEVYVYIMALPEATIPEYIGSGQYKQVDVFDLHSLQMRQAHDIIQYHPNENPGFVAQALCGYEAFVQKIEPSQVIGVVQCKRSDLLYNTVCSEVFPSARNYALNFSRWFQVQNTFTYNPNFSGDPLLRKKAIEKVRMVKEKGTQFTNSALKALQESNIEYDPKKLITTTFFWHELIHLNFLNAIISVMVSIRYFFCLLYHYVTSPDSQTLIIEEEVKDVRASELLPQLSLFRGESVTSQSQSKRDALTEMTELPLTHHLAC